VPRASVGARICRPRHVPTTMQCHRTGLTVACMLCQGHPHLPAIVHLNPTTVPSCPKLPCPASAPQASYQSTSPPPLPDLSCSHVPHNPLWNSVAAMLSSPCIILIWSFDTKPDRCVTLQPKGLLSPPDGRLTTHPHQVVIKDSGDTIRFTSFTCSSVFAFIP
jgi:hypothetical protein